MLVNGTVSLVDVYIYIGVLEKPGFDQRLPVLHRRLFLVGKSGIGKSSTVHKLMGRGMCVVRVSE